MDWNLRERPEEHHKDKRNPRRASDRSRSADSSSFFIVFSGLAADATVDDILSCLRDCTVIGGRDGVKMCIWRRMAFVELAAKDDIGRSFRGDRKCVGKNCVVNVDRIERSEVESIMRRTADELNHKCASSEGVVFLRGLPYACSKEEIATFFLGLPIAPNGITLLMDEVTGRATGDAFVQFTSSDHVAKALEKHKAVIQHRYIEVYQSSLTEMNKQMRKSRRSDCSSASRRLSPPQYQRSVKGVASRAERLSSRRRDSDAGRRLKGRVRRSPVTSSGTVGNKDRTSRTGCRIYMRGMPYSITETDIREFLAPVFPTRIVLEQINGRPTGNALVDLANRRDVETCMKKHGTNLRYRYVEIYQRSSVSSI